MDLDGIRESVAATVRVMERLGVETAPRIQETAEALAGVVAAGGKILLCGNGGSAADSQHVATELCVRYLRDRRPIPAIALTVDTSVLTAASNDLGFESVFARQVEAHGRAGDALIAISTSGNSPNVVRAVERASELGLVTVALTGASGGRLGPLVDWWLPAPTDHTPQVQEAHLVIEHLLCGHLEDTLREEAS